MKNLIDKLLSQLTFIYNKERIGNFLGGIIISFFSSALIVLALFLVICLLAEYHLGATARIICFSISFIICNIINFFIFLSENIEGRFYE